MLETLVLVRHAHASSNDEGCVSGVAPGHGLSTRGVEEALAARPSIAVHAPDLAVASSFARSLETLRILAPDVPLLVVPELDEIEFGAFEGGALEAYRAWAWSAGPETPCPGGGESRAAAAARIARGLGLLRQRPERTIVAVSHSLPIRYVLDAAAGRRHSRRLEAVPHVTPFVLGSEAVERAERALGAWALDPVFDDAPDGALRSSPGGATT